MKGVWGKYALVDLTEHKVSEYGIYLGVWYWANARNRRSGQ